MLIFFVKIQVLGFLMVSSFIYQTCFSLFLQGEGSLAYAQWVCWLLHHRKENSILVSTVPKPDMSHLSLSIRRIVSNASIALQKSTGMLYNFTCVLQFFIPSEPTR